MIGTNEVRVLPPQILLVASMDGARECLGTTFTYVILKMLNIRLLRLFCDVINLAFNLVVCIVMKVTNNIRYIFVEYALTN